jgi:hypothetical protein
LVNVNYELIDGLRRLRAVHSLGNTVIEVVPVTLFDPATVWLKRARLHGVLARPLSPRRLSEIYEACKPLIALTRSREMMGKNHGRGAHVHGREKFLDAIGIDSESYFQAATQLYRTAKEAGLRGQLAEEAVALVEEGKLSVYMGLEYVRSRQRPGDVVKPDEQLTMLSNISSSLAGMRYALGTLGPIDSSIDQGQLNDIIVELRAFRRVVHRLINQLEKGKDHE